MYIDIVYIGVNLRQQTTATPHTHTSAQTPGATRYAYPVATKTWSLHKESSAASQAPAAAQRTAPTAAVAAAQQQQAQRALRKSSLSSRGLAL